MAYYSLFLRCFCNAVTLFYGHANKAHCCCCCVHNRHLYVSAVESLLYVEAFETRYVHALLQTNQAGWLLIAHVFL